MMLVTKVFKLGW